MQHEQVITSEALLVTEEHLGVLAAIQAIKEPGALTPEERLANATTVMALAEAGVDVDVTKLHPKAIGSETIAVLHGLQKGRRNGF